MAPNSQYRFSGHETFTLRQLWLRKAIRYVQQANANGREPSFRSDEAMIVLGVGKNMVSSMKFWAMASGFFEVRDGKLCPTKIAERIFGNNDDEGLDPFAESLTTAWLVHWNLASTPNRLTAIWFLFNMIHQSSIARIDFLKKLHEFAASQGVSVTENSIKRDVEVCLRSYVPQITGRSKSCVEDELESLLGGLGLVQHTTRDSIEIVRTQRPSLPTPLFVWAILDEWERINEDVASNSLDWAQIAYAIGSPGRVFRLSEKDLNNRLEKIEELTDRKLIWTDQLGVKNLVRATNSQEELSELKTNLLRASY